MSRKTIRMDISSDKQAKLFTRDQDLDLARKGQNIKKELESFLIAAQNNDIRINYVKAKIDKTQ